MSKAKGGTAQYYFGAYIAKADIKNFRPAQLKKYLSNLVLTFTKGT